MEKKHIKNYRKWISLIALFFISSIANLPFLYGRRSLCVEWKQYQRQGKYSRIHPTISRISTHGIGLWCSTVHRWENHWKNIAGFGVWIASSRGQSAQAIPTNIRDDGSGRQMENCSRLLPLSRFNVPTTQTNHTIQMNIFNSFLFLFFNK